MSQDGWFDDPYGQHDGRYFSHGQPTNRVRDGNRFFFEDPPTEPPPDGELAVVVDDRPDTGAGGDVGGPEAAWYPDPTGPGHMRFWDGSQWTEQVMPAPVPVAVPAGGAPTPVPLPEPPAAPAPTTTPVDETDTEGAPMKPGVAAHNVEAAIPRAADLVDDTPPTPASASVPRPVTTPTGAGRGAHYVLAPGLDRPGTAGADTRSIVTGEVPPDYDRITLECENGEAVEATILAGGGDGAATLFVAVVGHRVRRIVATKDGGVYGAFLDVDQLEHDNAG
jgi:hypothetical protein